MKKKIRWITRTAIFLALLIAGQYLGKAGGQPVAGSIVNTVLITAALTAGIYSAGTVAVLSPIFAALAGVAPNWAFVPYIAVGNLVLVVAVSLIAGQKYKTKSIRIIMNVVGVLVGAALKCLVLWQGVQIFIVPTLTEQAAVKTMKMFAFLPQMMTALIGGAVALIIAPVIKKAIKK